MIIDHADTKNILVVSKEGKAIASYQPTKITHPYYILKHECDLNDSWLAQARKSPSPEEILEQMRISSKRVTFDEAREIKTCSLQNPFQIIVLLLYRLYGRKSGKVF